MAKIIDLKTRAILADLPHSETPRVMRAYPTTALNGKITAIACSSFGAHYMVEAIRAPKAKKIRKKKSA